MDNTVHPPEPGAVIWCKTASRLETLARVEGFEDAIVIAFSRAPRTGPRKVHLRQYFVRTDPGLVAALAKLTPVTVPQDGVTV